MRAANLQLTGADLLESIGRRLPAGLQAAIAETLRHGRSLLLERTGLAFQPFQADPPLEVDEDEVARVTDTLRRRGALARYEAHVQAALRLAPLRQPIAAEMQAWLDYDADFAFGCFALQNDLHPVAFAPALRFDASVHLSLAADATAQRIAYALGGDHKVALLTGANSGGKTTLLEHLAQLVTMARLGLPVVGSGVQVPWLDELHVVTSKRSMDAGAFESFLKSFLPVVLGTRRRLVLADEVESVTELEAAGRILGFFLDRLGQSQSLALLVTHLAPQILAHTRQPVRVDGIEATGLDERNRLVVDRTPRMGRMARSTPELIVQRLASTAKGAQGQLYADLLERFAGPSTARGAQAAGRIGGPG